MYGVRKYVVFGAPYRQNSAHKLQNNIMGIVALLIA